MFLFRARNFGLCLGWERGLRAEIKGGLLFCLGTLFFLVLSSSFGGSCWLPILMEKCPYFMTAALSSKLQYIQYKQMTTRIVHIFLSSEPNWASSSPDNIYSWSVPGITTSIFDSRFTCPAEMQRGRGGAGSFKNWIFLNLNTISSFDKRVSPNGRLRFACALDWLATEAMKKQNNHYYQPHCVI